MTATCRRPAPTVEGATPSSIPAATSAQPDAGPVVGPDSSSPFPSPSDRRPRALSRLVPEDTEDRLGPTGVVPGCEDKLRDAGVTFRSSQLPVHGPDGGQCGAPQVVSYRMGPGRITYDPAPVLTCAMALALASFEPIVQAEAERVFQSRVVRIEELGTYNCRQIAAFKGTPSEHSYANAIDLSRFMFANGKSVSVLADFDMGADPPSRPGGDFLRAISVRAYHEDIFSNVLTPFWNKDHRNHFHLDLARYSVGCVTDGCVEGRER
jgi:hypothetical protein